MREGFCSLRTGSRGAVLAAPALRFRSIRRSLSLRSGGAGVPDDGRVGWAETDQMSNALRDADHHGQAAQHPLTSCSLRQPVGPVAALPTVGMRGSGRGRRCGRVGLPEGLASARCSSTLTHVVGHTWEVAIIGSTEAAGAGGGVKQFTGAPRA